MTPPQSTRFEGHAALVTGAGRGIGAEIARRLAAEGAQVLIAEQDPERAERVAGAIADLGGTALAHPCDVTDPDSVREAVRHAVTAFGGLDVLVNNAYRCSPGTFDELTDELWVRDLDTTLLGAVRCCREAMPHLVASGHGAVVNIGSVNGEQNFGGDAYSAAKAGLASLTRTLAGAYGRRGVRVNLIAPGTIRTPVWDDQTTDLDQVATHYPLGRVGTPADVAAAALFLASTDASWITGVTLPVDGGILMSNSGLLRSFGFDPEP
ncbi:oxidoreductase [Wenjunlia vitaminophila]|uniref:Oxidoreductase n=1 Tax=Wenjunlia vitaminophila TaxID=76728 RepID=A0A0T6LRU5_WENVI|nr:SDR family NAD(P)-dependent oxidoreductase [Wenjunlia vitaminophila]KRV48862.1 oxidoreductase [Wenjunlia vitaminophila]